MRKRFGILIPLLVLFAMFSVFLVARPAHTAAAINQQINFQGKLTNPDGTNVTDGTYSIVFTIYSGGTSGGGGSNVWTETQPSVAVASGIFQVALGSVNTALASSVNFNSTPLFLGVKVGADAEMTPLIQFTAAPYAFDADQVGGLTSASLVQLGQNATAQTDSSTSNASVAINKTGTTAKILDLQRGGSSVLTVNNDGSILAKNQADSAAGFKVQGTTNVLLTANTTASQIIIGAAVTDNVQVLLQLDSFDTFADTATCGTTTNQGGIYYNTKSNAVRACTNGAWEDLVSTGGLGLQLFGVVPDSGANPGDIYSVTGVQNGPCKVSAGANLQTVSWTACTAYSGGRKVIVTAGTAGTVNGVAGQFQHLCLTAANGQPALSTAGAETANLATVSLPSITAPILCLADIKFTGANNTITQIYDTRTYTTTDKNTMALNSATGVGALVAYVATKGTVQATNGAAANGIAGVVVATTGAASATTVNAIVATGGPAAVKAITGTNLIGAYIESTTTAGYANTAANPAAATTLYNVLGNARNAWSGATACTINSDTCAGSVITDIDKR